LSLVVVGMVVAACSGSPESPPVSAPPATNTDSPDVGVGRQSELRPTGKERVSVELWRTGDDGLTARFAALLEDQLNAVGLAVVAGGQARTPRTLVVTIPSSLAWKRVGSRVQVAYSLQFAGPLGEVLGTSGGTCWEDELATCIGTAVGDAQSAASKLRTTA
jgi:hypothetical protein